ncbi:unnamed protein product, partial [Mycena citricolor]
SHVNSKVNDTICIYIYALSGRKGNGLDRDTFRERQELQEDSSSNDNPAVVDGPPGSASQLFFVPPVGHRQMFATDQKILAGIQLKDGSCEPGVRDALFVTPFRGEVPAIKFCSVHSI